MSKPLLHTKLSVKDFKDFYWLKEELADFFRGQGIAASGAKTELAARILSFLETGKRNSEPKIKKEISSRFDWNSEKLSTQTLITDSYKNSENVRAFFIQEIGKQFHFSVEFMNWTKLNAGKTLADAIREWKRLYELKKDKTFKTDIAPQFEYNRYMRAFLKGNPGKSSKEAMKYWNAKRLTRGTKEYSREDLHLLNHETKTKS